MWFLFPLRKNITATQLTQPQPKKSINDLNIDLENRMVYQEKADFGGVWEWWSGPVDALFLLITTWDVWMNPPFFYCGIINYTPVN